MSAGKNRENERNTTKKQKMTLQQAQTSEAGNEGRVKRRRIKGEKCVLCLRVVIELQFAILARMSLAQ